MIKYIILLLLLPTVPAGIYAQQEKVTLSRDSIMYYQKELAAMRKASYDSLINSEKYKAIYNRLYPGEEVIKEKVGVEIQFGIGFQTNNLSGLNSRLGALNISKQQPNTFSYGASLAFRFYQLLIGGSAYGVSAKNMNGTTLQGFLSTNIIRIKKTIISPQVGFGSQSYNITRRTASTATNFDSYFTSAGNKVSISHRSPVLDFSLSLKVLNGKDNTYSQLIRMGYIQGLKDKAWKVEKGNSANAPVDRVGSFYVQLLLGMGT